MWIDTIDTTVECGLMSVKLDSAINRTGLGELSNDMILKLDTVIFCEIRRRGVVGCKSFMLIE